MTSALTRKDEFKWNSRLPTEQRLAVLSPVSWYAETPPDSDPRELNFTPYFSDVFI